MNDAEKFIKEFNQVRRANKGKWIQFGGIINGDEVWIKSYDTYIQIAKFRGLNDGTPCDCNVRAMNEWLAKFLSYGEA